MRLQRQRHGYARTRGNGNRGLSAGERDGGVVVRAVAAQREGDVGGRAARVASVSTRETFTAAEQGWANVSDDSSATTTAAAADRIHRAAALSSTAAGPSPGPPTAVAVPTGAPLVRRASR